jgi:hypothetical protein
MVPLKNPFSFGIASFHKYSDILAIDKQMPPGHLMTVPCSWHTGDFASDLGLDVINNGYENKWYPILRFEETKNNPFWTAIALSTSAASYALQFRRARLYLCSFPES